MKILLALLLLAGSAAAAERPLVVLAAASLTDAFYELGALHGDAQFNFGASNELRLQLEHGAPGDVFAPASDKEMNRAAAAGLIEGSPVAFARNVLAVVVPASNPAGIEKLGDLARPGLKVLLAHANVPAGGYALESLGKAGEAFKTKVLANVVSYETNVRQVIAKLQLGEADAGIAYLSDVTPASANRLRAIPIPVELNVVATYPIGVVKTSRRKAAARAFIDFVLSERGQAVLEKYAFKRVTR